MDIIRKLRTVVQDSIRRRPPPIDPHAAQESRKLLDAQEIRRLLNADVSVAARFRPDHDGYEEVIHRRPPPVEVACDGLPLPPPSIRLDPWFGDGPEQYMERAQLEHRNMMRCLSDVGFHLRPGDAVLDFGCAGGRLTRLFASHARSAEVWGVDLWHEGIRWCSSYLTPPFHFHGGTTLPHLPFEDRFFSLIFAGSVFTHIWDHEDAWLVELRRILRPEGRFYATIHDNRTIEIMRGWTEEHPLYHIPMCRRVVELDASERLLEEGFDRLVVERATFDAQVFHDRDYIRRHWGSIFRVESFTDEVYGYQTGVVMARP